jgi:hypothetical protein
LRVAIHQPNFLPRLKVLQKLAAAEVWVVLDNVQYCEREWQNRARIIAAHGDSPSFWLSVPVRQPRGQLSRIDEVRIIDPTSTERLLTRTFGHALRRTPYWNCLDRYLTNVRQSLNTDTLTSLCVETTHALLDIAGKKPRTICSSSLPVTGKASALMAAICRYLDADTYLADSGAGSYLCAEDFVGITVLWQEWKEPVAKWPGIDSWRDLSVVNYLCREGDEEFKGHFMNGLFSLRRYVPAN